MAAPSTNASSVLHPQYHSCRELAIVDETQTSQAATKFGWGVAPVAASSRVAFTQTYATAEATVPNATYSAPAVTSSAVATTAVTQTTPYGFSTSAQGDALIAQGNANKMDIAATNTALAALAADVLALKKCINSLIDAHQALGLVT